MVSNKRIFRSVAALIAISAGSAALAQSPADWPTHKGSNERTGLNGRANNTGPGRGLLHWYSPTNPLDLIEIHLDNTDIANTRTNFPGQGPFDAPLFGSLVRSPDYNPLNGAPNANNEWAWPAVDSEAVFPYLRSIRNNTITIGPDVYPRNFNSRFPAYLYTRVTPSLRGGSPTQAANAAERRTIRYDFQGPAGIQRNYALYVWLPVGPTLVGGTRVFPQRYFVYEVRTGAPGNIRSYVDVIDTYVSGGGWVRIGNGGADTNAVFPWDGTNRLSVILYNTVPRDSEGNLSMPHPANNEAAVDQYIVYADAARAVPVSGLYEASPISARLDETDPNTTLLIDAKTELSVASTTASIRTIAQGVLTARQYNNLTQAWQTLWRYAPTGEQTDATITADNSVAAVAGSFVPDPIPTRFSGADVYTADLQAAATGTVSYAPTLNAGTYEVFVYLPGDNNGQNYGHNVQYQVIAESTTFNYTVNQSLARGWVKLGDRRFRHTTANPIQVIVTNQSGDPTDLTRKAYADAIRFTGERDSSISSTPVYATARIRQSDMTLVDTKVVITADESGVLHCLDAAGNGDGTTTEYWSYPSQTDPDPNQVDGQDGVGGIAEMPQGFELSSAIVQRISGLDYLFIGSRNGRVYCIEMAGRGDFQPRQAGTTVRRWTYPSTYPDPITVSASPLGAFRGSLVFANPGGIPTIYAPTTQGRIYALDARGNAANKRTTVRWAYPALTQPTLGPIVMTPAFHFDSIYFGTQKQDDEPGRFFSLNAANGAVNWELPAGATAYDDFVSSPAVVTYRIIANSAAAPAGGVVYTLNQNRVLYAIDAATGTILWQTDELGTGGRAAISYTRMTVFSNIGVPTQEPVIMVPTQDGRFVGLYADPDPLKVNRFGTKRAYEYVAQGDTVVATNAMSNGWMFGADNLGFLYGWTNTSGGIGPGDPVPGQETIVENNPIGDVFRKAKLKLVTREAYQRLRLPTGDANQLTYQQALSNAFSFTRTPLAFEWGETAYIMVYDFPYLTRNLSNTRDVPPPIINVSFNVDGRTVRGVAVEAREFVDGGAGNPPELDEIQPDLGLPPPPEGNLKVNGYAILAFPFQGGGANALPPGDAHITFSISTQSLNGNGAQQRVALNPALSRTPFKMANPIAIASRLDASGQPIPNGAIGYDADPNGIERLLNGSPRVGAVRKDLIGVSTGWAQHGQSKSTKIYVYDTSMMGLLRPDGMGLDNVRLVRSDLARQAGAAGVYKPIDQTLYPGFEDLPLHRPNTSVDYPDLPRENVRATKDPDGSPENPLFNGVQLYAPLIQVGATTRPLQEGDLPEDRVFRPTEFVLDVDVPRYQPPVNFDNPGAAAGLVPNSFSESHNSGYLQGYMGRLSVFVDSFQNGQLDRGQREAYRAFNLATAVTADESIATTTPTVDLGSLPTGAGYSAQHQPGFAFNPTGPTPPRALNPWAGMHSGMFKEFGLQNRGNVNMLNLRLAKAYDSWLEQNTPSNETWPFKIPGTATDPFSWLESGWTTSAGNLFTGNIWSDLDWQFSPWPQLTNPQRQVILQKPRVTDRVPTELTVNPRRRAIPGLGITDQPRFNVARFPVRSPRVTATIPIGLPSGQYRQRLRIIEEQPSTPNPDILPTWNLLSASVAEPASDPTFDILFTVRESRLTNGSTPGTDRMLDNELLFNPDGSPTVYSQGTLYSHQQPAAVRDAFGSLIVAFSSNRPSWAIDPTVPADPNNPYKLYIGTLDSAWSFTPGGMAGPAGQNPVAPLRDLNNWNRATPGRWFRQEAYAWPRNQTPDTLFSSQPGESIIPSTVRYVNPSFPQTGMTSPFDPNLIFQGMYMAFIGEAQKSTPTGRLTESRLMATIVRPDASGQVTLVPAFVSGSQPLVAKGKPSVVQTPSGAMVFHAGASGGQTALYYSRITGQAFGPSTPLPLGNGFESVSRPSAAGRPYVGANGAGNIIELTFGGKLRGRPNAEVFLGRLEVLNGDRLVEDANGNLGPSPFLWQPVQGNEPLTPESGGVYRARGTVWNLAPRDLGAGNFEPAFNLVQNLNGNVTRILLDGWSFNGTIWTYVAADDTRAYDPQTGILSYDSRLGGKAYVDSNLGTIRFSGGTPASAALLTLTYQPQFLRVTAAATAGYAGPTGLWDGRLISEVYDYKFGPAANDIGSRYWRRANGSVHQATDAVVDQERYRNDRMVFTFTRAASGSGQAARPYISTMRLGVRLPSRIQTDDSGAPVNVAVTTMGGGPLAGPYQIDPAQGKIYVTAVDEDRRIRVTYWGVDAAGNPLLNSGGGRDLVVDGTVSYIGERAEEPILIEQAVNESGLSPYLDQFNYLSDRRPPMVWLFWTSTRGGQPDLYFQTIAPRWSPVPLGR